MATQEQLKSYIYFGLDRYVMAYVREYDKGRGEYLRPAGFGHAPDSLAARQKYDEIVLAVRERGKPLTEEERIDCADFVYAMHEGGGLDMPHVRELLDKALAFTPEDIPYVVPPMESLFTGENRIRLNVPSDIFARAVGNMMQTYMRKGTTFHWEDQQTKQVLFLIAHPLINGHSGYIDPYTYCG